MADSPLLNSDGVLSVVISSDGTTLSTTIEIVGIEIEKRINRISSATLIFNDGDMPNADFPVSNTAAFAPGSAIVIQAGYNANVSEVFSGIIVRHAIRVGSNNTARLIIECKDKALKMTVGRKNESYIDKKDSDIITQLIGNSAGLTADVTATTTQHKELLQYYCSDWDYMLARAELNGMFVTLDAGTVSVQAPDASLEPALTVTYGIDIMDFHAELDARNQFSSVKATSWDPATLAITEQQSGQQTLTEQGNITGATLAAVLGLATFQLQSYATLETPVLTEWAKAQQTKAELARIRGHVSFQGSSAVKPGKLLELKGVGDRFNGKVIVSAVTHSIGEGNWTTRVDFGLPAQWFSEQHDLAAPSAAGVTAGIRGLHIGIVKKLDSDPEGQYKVQVSVPLMGAGDQGVWARLSNFYSSNSFGAFFIPEIGDEVILGFLNEDPSNPIILGSVYGSKNKAPYELTSDNFTKAIVTRSKMKLEFDEDKKKITLVTPGKNTIVICDDTKSILIQDQTNNKIELTPSGISLDSPKDITITAKGKITIDAVGNVEVTSKADIKEAALNIGHTAQVGFTAKGTASAEVSASGTTTIKGAMVLIN